MRHALGFMLLVAMAGCASLSTPQVDMHPVSVPDVPAAAPAPVATRGAIFQASTHRPLFEDRRARLVGDLLTIQIEEQVTASQQSSSKVDRSGSMSAGVKAFPFSSANALGKLSADVSSSTDATADGKTNSANTFSGTITLLVRQVLPNGNLLVVGEKQLGVNQNVDVVRFSGIVDPATIRGGNVVSSTQVAEARLEQRGRGDIGRIQGLGWLSRFFLSVAPV